MARQSTDSAVLSRASGVSVPLVTLNSGRSMPLLGLGTVTMDRLGEEQLAGVFLEAMEAGYRHFDTAAAYGTERPLGRAIEEALRRGTVRSRDELFITSKLWCSDADADLVIPAIRTSLDNLGIDYLDLYLIHWPVRMQPGEIRYPRSAEDILPFDGRSTWAAMEECVELGLTKSIGVSNFSSKKLEELLAGARILPAVNQVEMNPAWHQEKLRGFCKEKGIAITAWSPLGANGAIWGSTAVVESPVLKEIARTKGKSLAQVALRWIIEQHVAVVVKSFNKERMRENLQIFDWELTEEEKVKIGLITQKKGFSGASFLSPNGYKTLYELWDGEI